MLVSLKRWKLEEWIGKTQNDRNKTNNDRDEEGLHGAHQ